MSSAAIQLTDQQRRAIEHRETSVALSAGAGCGKTFVLTQRFLSHLEPSGEPASGADLGSLVAITFTDRAAREMRDRIRTRCYQRLEQGADEEAPYWLELLRGLDRARVSTIHAFCSTLLRSHAVQAGLDPRFRVLDATEAAMLVRETIDDQLHRRLAQNDAATIDLVHHLQMPVLRSDLQELLAVFVGPRASSWLTASPDEQVARWQEIHLREVLPALAATVSSSPEVRRFLDRMADGASRHKTIAGRHADLQQVTAWLQRVAESRGSQIIGFTAAEFAEQLGRLREATKFNQLGGKAAWGDEAALEETKQAAKALRAWIDKQGTPTPIDAAEAREHAAIGLQLLRLAGELAKDWNHRKAEEGLVDFDDLIHRAVGFLGDARHEALRRRLSRQLTLLLVDEFQDTDPLQVELVRRLCGDDLRSGKLFFVGDFKQSIYRFRGADPQVFRQLQHDVPPAGRMPLTLNFRSQPAILKFVNALFCNAFEEYEPLEASRQQVADEPAVELLWADSADLPREKGAAAAARSQEADLIARRIARMLDDGERHVWAKSPEGPIARPVRPGDIALLFRAMSDVRYYEEALDRYGIDYYVVGGRAFYAQQEIYDLANLLRAVASPGDAVSLAGVLRSPMFSLSDEAIFWLGQHPGGLSAGLFAGRLPEELDDESRSRAARAAETLSALRKCKDRLPVADLILETLERTGYDAVLLAEFLGERKLANLRKLIDDARRFDRSGMFGLSDFIVQLSEFVARQPDEPLAATHPETSDVVRLMSVHQSKGLEFPVVFVPDLDRRPVTQGPSVVYDDRLGPLVSSGSGGPTVGYDLWKFLTRQADQQERDRLFYVACTRAADYLVLSSSIDDPDKLQGPWIKLLAERFDLESGKLTAPLPAGFHQPQVRVTTDCPVDSPRTGRKRTADWPKQVAKVRRRIQQGGLSLPAQVHPVGADPDARRRFSFSRLSGMLEELDLQFEKFTASGQVRDARPSSAQPAAVWGGTQRPAPDTDANTLGQFVHAILEQIELGPDAPVAQLAGTMAARLPAVDEQLAAEAIRLVEQFLGSPRAAELARARQVHRELEFMLAWPPGESAAGGVYLQGYIDCLYQDGDRQWHILDYKTNRVTADQVAGAAESYFLQLQVYALAVEQVLGNPPASMALHFLRPGCEFVLPYEAAAREQAVAAVNRLISPSVWSQGDKK